VNQSCGLRRSSGTVKRLSASTPIIRWSASATIGWKAGMTASLWTARRISTRVVVSRSSRAGGPSMTEEAPVRPAKLPSRVRTATAVLRNQAVAPSFVRQWNARRRHPSPEVSSHRAVACSSGWRTSNSESERTSAGRYPIAPRHWALA
jgi:hypothetical protein